MAGALDVELAKDRFRQAADRLGEQTLRSLLRKPPRATLWAVAGAAGVGLLLGRNGSVLRAMRAALPVLLRVAAQVEKKAEEEES